MEIIGITGDRITAPADLPPAGTPLRIDTSAIPNGMYIVAAVFADGCMDTLDCIPVSDTEAPAIAEGEALRIWPNPAGSRVSYEYAGAGKCVGVSLADMASGKVVLQQHSAGSAGALDIAAVPAGMYVLALQMRDGTVVRRKLVVLK